MESHNNQHVCVRVYVCVCVCACVWVCVSLTLWRAEDARREHMSSSKYSITTLSADYHFRGQRIHSPAEQTHAHESRAPVLLHSVCENRHHTSDQLIGMLDNKQNQYFKTI